MNYPRSASELGKKAEDWVVVVALPNSCTACMICEQVCPHGFITMSVTQ
ncbi:MAG: 4Fe-4S binding protein [Dehalococcoidia bacterium]